MVVTCVILIILIAGVDLICKKNIESKFESDEYITCCKDKITIRKVHNKGMCMSWMQHYPETVRNCSFVALVVIFIYQLFLCGKQGNVKEKVGTALIAGGAVSNTYDRIKRGYVVDYIGFNCKWKKAAKVTYNFGDFAIFAGALLLMITNLKKK